MTGSWEPVIGLELHVQLATRSKMFSGAATAYGAAPNTQACGIDLALPGTLPVINAGAVRLAVMFGIAIGARIAARSVFARKNYFYPDLPKGYQISQYELPIVEGGQIEVEMADVARRMISITRAHLEEDAGKSLHDGMDGWTGIDLNRAGTPLIEIVTEPVMHTAAEAAACMRTVHSLVRYLGISDGNMQEGSFRCDANVSLRRRGDSRLGTRTEIKNLNSFRFVEQAVDHEIDRQIGILEGGGAIVQETRLYDPELDETRPLRLKEEAHDYRYFPDPDLLPVELSAAEVAAIRETMPELPAARRRRFSDDYGLAEADARLLTTSRELADYFESVVRSGAAPKAAANWINGDLSAALNREGREIVSCPVPAGMLGGLLARIADGTISGRIAKQVFEAIWNGEGDADSIIERKGLRQVSDAGHLENLVEEVIRGFPEQAEQFCAGKDKVLAFLVGQVMKMSAGRANPQQVNELLQEKLRKR